MITRDLPLPGGELPPLPDYGIIEWVGDEEKGEPVFGFTEDQMYEYARAAIEAAHGIKDV